MRSGRNFEVPKDVYERAQKNGGRMAPEDQPRFFSESILIGYGLYSCIVREENGKYICSYMIGDSCD